VGSYVGKKLMLMFMRKRRGNNMLPIACVCEGWTMDCRYCYGTGWVMLGRFNEKKEGQ